MVLSDKHHGTTTGYRYGCRCDDCREAATLARSMVSAEKASLYQARYKERHREKKLAAQRADRERYPARHARSEYERVTKGKGEICVITEREFRRLLVRHGHACFYCGAREDLTVDHLVPSSRGGRHSIGNIVPACRKCNSSKWRRTVMEWKKRKKASEVERGSVGSASTLPGGVEPRALAGPRSVLRGSGAGRGPTHELQSFRQFSATDYSALCSCGAMSHKLSSLHACEAWVTVHGAITEKLRERS